MDPSISTLTSSHSVKSPPHPEHQSITLITSRNEHQTICRTAPDTHAPVQCQRACEAADAQHDDRQCPQPAGCAPAKHCERHPAPVKLASRYEVECVHYEAGPASNEERVDLQWPDTHRCRCGCCVELSDRMHVLLDMNLNQAHPAMRSELSCGG